MDIIDIKDINIQKMHHKDINVILEIEQMCYGAHHWSYEAFLNELNNKISSYNCIFYKDICIGYIGFWKIIDEAHVTNLSVHPEYRNKKIAHRLLISMFDECYKEKIKYITLEVRVTNQKAINLYEKFGFKSLGLRKKYYQDNNEDALIMWSENIFDIEYKKLYTNIKKECNYD